jgi:hypothetical protein
VRDFASLRLGVFALKTMRLFEAIIDANHRAVDGDASAGLHPADFSRAGILRGGDIR